MRKFSWLEPFGSLLIYAVIFLYTLSPYADKDWGWHFRYGEYFFTHGKLLLQNPYSWTLPDYHWINPSWGYDVVTYVIYHYWGFIGFSFIGSAVALAIFFIITRRARLHFWQKGILAFFYLQLTYLATTEGLRSQGFASLFFAIVYYLLAKLETKSPVKYTIPLVFLVFANVHGLFTVALALFGLFIVTQGVFTYNAQGIKGLQTRSFMLAVLLFFVSCIVTFINPFTYHIYVETLKHWQNPALTHIYEWFPISRNVCLKGNDICSTFWVYTILLIISAVVFFVRFRRPLTVFYVISTILLLGLTINSQRYLMQLSVVSIPLVAQALEYLTEFAQKYVIIPIIAIGLSAFFVYQLGTTKLPMFLGVPYGFYEYCQFAVCPEKAVQFLIKNPPEGIGFNYYDWGGYLIGRGVPAKLFVDGRMTIWEDHGVNPFADFINIYYGGDLILFQRYNFQWVLLQTDNPLANTLLHPSRVDLGTWVIRYEDPIAIYLVRTNTTRPSNAYQF